MDIRRANILESWKEVAEFIARDERTAMRWAKTNGMPVHRVPGGKRGHIFAYRHEIQAWLDGRGEMNEILSPLQHLPDTVSHAALDASTRIVFVRRKWKLLAVASGIILLVWTAGRITARGDIQPAIRVTGFTKLTSDSRPKSHLHTDGKTLYFTETEGMHTFLVSMPVSGGQPHRIDTPFPNLILQDVSRDGSRLLLTPFEGIEFDKPLWELSPKTSNLQRVGDLLCFLARWSPDGKAIAFARGGQLWVSDSKGAGAQLLTSFGDPIEGLAWSPVGDRLRILVSERPSGRIDLWDMPLEPAAGTPSQTPIHLGDQDPSTVWTWFDKGARFVYGNMNADEKSTIRVVDGGRNPWATNVSQPSFSLNVGRIEGLSAAGPGQDLYLTASTEDHAELLQLDQVSHRFQPLLPGLSAKRVSFSRDGVWMCYVDGTTQSLWRGRVGDTHSLQLTSSPMVVETASWSPDATHIAFMGKLPGIPWRIYLMPKDGGEFQAASPQDFAQGAASWSPDGRSIVYAKVGCENTHSCGLHKLDLISGSDEPIEGSEGLRTARWSYDGKYIAALDPVRHQLFVMTVKNGHWRMLADMVTGDDVSWSRNSQFIYFDDPQGERPVIERVRVADGQRSEVVSLFSLQALVGSMDSWFGLAPDDSVIVARLIHSSEIYALHLAER